MVGVRHTILIGDYRSGYDKDVSVVFGLVETIEKAAEIYMKVCDKKIVQSISNENLLEIAEAFKINFRRGIID